MKKINKEPSESDGSSIKKQVYLDFDDFGEFNNRLDWLWMLKKEFPNFKVNLFAIPEQNQHLQWMDYLRSLDWIQLCVHGYWHDNNEEIPEIMLRDDFPMKGFAKVYRAPFWQLSDNMYQILKKLNYKIMIHPDDLREGIKYNWNIKGSPPPLDILYGHGHIQDVCENGLVEAFENIMKLPKDTEFKFL
jgi:hypothetical protein